jgi:SAM-dependent methyltransferase
MLSVGRCKNRFNADSKTPSERFFEGAVGMVNKDSVVLHAGCGTDSSIGFRDAAQVTIGLDLDEWLGDNADLDLAVIGSLCHIPLPAESVDLVAARWVLEHLIRPDLFFQEVARVLRPAGHLILCTPNRYHYFALAVRITPLRFQRWFMQHVLGGDPHSVFPTFYRANTSRRIRSLAAGAGLVVERLYRVEGSPNILGFSLIVYLAGVAYEQIVNRFRLLTGFRGMILAVLSK